MMKRILTLMISATICTAALAQSIKVDTKFGKVSEEECKMREYPADTSAVAVLLFEEHDSKLDFDTHAGAIYRSGHYAQRLKILKEEGRHLADGSLFESRRRGRTNSYRHIQIATYNYEDGKIVVSKLGYKDIVRSEFEDDIYKLTYAPVNVKVGSVVEISYDYETADIFGIGDFYFQKDIPVNYSHYKIALPAWAQFGKVMRGYHTVEHKRYLENGADLGAYLPNNELNVDEYTAVDVPALKKESRVYCIRQFRSAVSYDITAITLPDYHKDFSSTWAKVAVSIREARLLKTLTSTCPIQNDINAALEGIDDDAARLAAVAKTVQQKVKFNGEDGGFADIKTAQVIKSASGSACEMNAIAAQALSAAGYHVSPVFVRSRSRGYLQTNHPTLSAFDYFILRVEKDGKVMMLDASDKYGAPNVLDDDLLVTNALCVTEDSWEWIDLTGLCNSSANYLVTMTLSPDGTVNGSFSYVAAGMEARDERLVADNIEEEKYIELIEKKLSVEVNDFEKSNYDFGSMRCQYKFDFTGHSTVAGDMIILDPFMIHFQDASEFYAEERHLPVEFRYPTTIKYRVTLTIPEGYCVDQMPEATRYSSDLPSNTTLMCGQTGAGTIQLSYTHKLGTMLVIPENYAHFKQYWTDLSNIYSQKIILKKIAE